MLAANTRTEGLCRERTMVRLVVHPLAELRVQRCTSTRDCHCSRIPGVPIVRSQRHGTEKATIEDLIRLAGLLTASETLRGARTKTGVMVTTVAPGKKEPILTNGVVKQVPMS